jgi:hypothetical protein
MTYPNAARLLEAISSSALIWWRLLHKTVKFQHYGAVAKSSQFRLMIQIR